MAQILDPIPNNQTSDRIICCYVNATSSIQVARITNIENWYFERVVFPGQRLVFEALPDALLEIHSGMMASSILSDTIPCKRLWLNEMGNSEKSEKSEKSAQNEQKNEQKNEPSVAATTENSEKKDEKNHNSLNNNLVTSARF